MCLLVAQFGWFGRACEISSGRPRVQFFALTFLLSSSFSFQLFAGMCVCVFSFSIFFFKFPLIFLFFSETSIYMDMSGKFLVTFNDKVQSAVREIMFV